MRGIYKVNEANMDWLEEYIAKVNKRARKLGQQEVEYKVVGESIEEVEVMGRDDDGTPLDEMVKAMIKVLDVEITSEVIKVGDYEFVALIEHNVSNGRNLVHSIEGISIAEEYYTIESRCQHCNTNRRRKYTVILQNTDGAFIQVGKSCLKDFVGIDVDATLKFSDLLIEMDKEISERGEYIGEGQITYLDLNEYLLYVAYEIDKNGYTSKSKAESPSDATSNIAYSTMMKCKYGKDKIEYAPSADIKDSIEWIRSKEDCTSEYMMNLQTICSNNMLRYKDMGFVSSLLPTYRRYLEDKMKKELAEIGKGNSNYVGTVGAREVFELTLANFFSFDTEYGCMTIYKFVDEDGNAIVWKSSKYLEQEIGDKVRLKGTIKDHSVYNNERQTVLTRCALVK